MFEHFETSSRQERDEMGDLLRTLYQVDQKWENETFAAARQANSDSISRQHHTTARASLNTLEIVFDILGIDYSQF